MKRYSLHFGAYYTADAVVEAESREAALAMADALRETADFEYAGDMSTEVEECTDESPEDAEDEHQSKVFVLICRYRDEKNGVDGMTVASFCTREGAMDAMRDKISDDRRRYWEGRCDISEEWSPNRDAFSAWKSWEYEKFHYNYQIDETVVK